VNSVLFFLISRRSADLRYKNVDNGTPFSYVRARLVRAAAFLKLKVKVFDFSNQYIVSYLLSVELQERLYSAS
jgi:hypothetical protein